MKEKKRKTGRKALENQTTLIFQLPIEVKERIPKANISEFVRQAIIEKLNRDQF